MNSAPGNAPSFKESLPPSCPPNGAGPYDFPSVYRFVRNKPVKEEDFDSHQALEKKGGRKCPRAVPPCLWAATSFFLDRDAAFRALPKPRARFRYIVRVKLTMACGVSVLSRSHISFWRYSTFRPNALDYESL